MIRMENKYINNFLSLKPFLKESISTNKVGKWYNNKIGHFEYCTANVGNEKYRCWFKEMFITCCSTMDKHLYWHSIEQQDTEDKGRGFIVGFLIIRCYYDVKIDNITDVCKFYYNKIRNCNYSLFDDDDFHEQLLKDENEHYLYTKEKLFPFFDEEAREILTKFTRNFFKYAQKQGCIGEFVEDVREDVINTEEIKDEVNVKLDKVNRIISSLNQQWSLSNGVFVPYDKIEINIIYGTIFEFIKNGKSEVKYKIDRNDKAAQHRSFALKYCTKILYPNSDEPKEWWNVLAELFNIKINSLRKNIQNASPERDYQEAIESIFRD